VFACERAVPQANGLPSVPRPGCLGLPPGIAVIGGGAGGAPTVQTVNQPANRYRLQLFLQAQNITNHANYVNYSGTMTSPFFRQPTNVLGTRKVDIGMSLTF